MRLFTAVDPPVELAGVLEAQIARWKPHAKLRWSRVENLHITTKFIGEWPEERLGELKKALDGVPSAAPGGPFPVSLRGLGWFPNPHAPKIFWVPVQVPVAVRVPVPVPVPVPVQMQAHVPAPAQGGDRLRALAAATDAALAQLGIAPEKRPYTPHLTLARIPPGASIAELRRQVAQLPVADWGTFATTEFHLYESRQGPSGSVYSRIHTVSL